MQIMTFRALKLHIVTEVGATGGTCLSEVC